MRHDDYKVIPRTAELCSRLKTISCQNVFFFSLFYIFDNGKTYFGGDILKLIPLHFRVRQKAGLQIKVIQKKLVKLTRHGKMWEKAGVIKPKTRFPNRYPWHVFNLFCLIKRNVLNPKRVIYLAKPDPKNFFKICLSKTMKDSFHRIIKGVLMHPTA